jgi:cytochrome d ubiquinol oxidase subunit II
MKLTTVWFVVIAVLWAGFFVLEGFDLGVGMLHRYIGKDESGRRAAISTVAPVWDGNEVWLVVAGAGMFAAFPDWYATLFSALYLAVVLLLAALIVRGVSFEFRAKVRDERWRTVWSWTLVIGSLFIPLIIGIALGDLLAGLPINSSFEFTGSFADIFTGYGVFVGLTLVVLCVLQGALFMCIKTTGRISARAGRVASWLSVPTVLVVLAFVIWTRVSSGNGVLPNPLEIIAVFAVIAVAWLAVDGHYGWAFAAMATTIAAVVLALFGDLYPRVMVSSLSSNYDLTVTNAASGSYALKLMTVIVVIFLPVVLIYQGWTYHVFRARIQDLPAVPATGDPSPDGAGDTAHAAAEEPRPSG